LKCLAVKAGEIKLTPGISQATVKLNDVQDCVNPFLMHL